MIAGDERDVLHPDERDLEVVGHHRRARQGNLHRRGSRHLLGDRRRPHQVEINKNKLVFDKLFQPNCRLHFQY